MRLKPPPILRRALAVAAFALGFWLIVAATPAFAVSCGSPSAVTLDIGHSPERPGAISARGRTEYSFNRDLALDLEAALRSNGTEVRLLNEKGLEISLTARARELSGVKRGIILSLHHDFVQPHYLEHGQIDGKPATFTRYPAARGYSIFVSGRSASFAASESLARALGAALRNAGFRPSSHHGDPIQGEGRPFLDPKLGVFRYDGLLVLRLARVPAVLFEAGVIANPEEELVLEDPDRRAFMVAAMVKGITSFCGPSE